MIKFSNAPSVQLTCQMKLMKWKPVYIMLIKVPINSHFFIFFVLHNFLYNQVFSIP